jgi:hypothetical protein
MWFKMVRTGVEKPNSFDAYDYLHAPYITVDGGYVAGVPSNSLHTAAGIVPHVLVDTRHLLDSWHNDIVCYEAEGTHQHDIAPGVAEFDTITLLRQITWYSTQRLWYGWYCIGHALGNIKGTWPISIARHDAVMQGLKEILECRGSTTLHSDTAPTVYAALKLREDIREYDTSGFRGDRAIVDALVDLATAVYTQYIVLDWDMYLRNPIHLAANATANVVCENAWQVAKLEAMFNEYSSPKCDSHVATEAATESGMCVDTFVPSVDIKTVLATHNDNE